MPKLTVKQLKAIIRESMQEMGMEDDQKKKEELASIYSDVYKEKHGIRPRWHDWQSKTVEELEADLEALEAETGTIDYSDVEVEEPFFPKEEEIASDEMEHDHEHDMESLPMRSGMGRRLTENLKAIVREAYEAACMECGYEESVKDESVQSKDMEHRKASMGMEEEALEEYLAEAKKSMRLGQGGRFEKLTDKLKSQGKSEESAKAIAASIGRKKYGKAKMAHWAKAGKKRASKE